MPFIPDSHLEIEADGLLQEYGADHSLIMKPPVPVEDVIEKQLHIAFQISDLRTLLNDPGVLGATNFKEETILVDESLDPELHPNQEGRYHFTLAHEVGHWRLHKARYLKAQNESSFWGNPSLPDIVCRDGDVRDPQEIQAEKFAAYFLMPKTLVFNAWKVLYPDISFITAAEWRQWSFSDKTISDDSLLNDAAQPLARLFCVSKTAMRIRLESLGLLKRTDQLSLT